jgi:predicted nucleotidyltransferase component of viral defense system
VRYETAQALRTALEQRLLNRSRETGVSVDRLRRRVLFERVVARLQAAEPGRWVLKGGMALEVRLEDRARITKDLDLGLRDEVIDGEQLHERLADLLASDPDDDRFVLTAEPIQRLLEDGAGHVTWRTKVSAHLAGRPFGRLQLDISPRSHELTAPECVVLSSALAFAGIGPREIEIINVHRHGAEKLHGMLRIVADHENTRVRDLVDVVILIEHELTDPPRLKTAVREVWSEREGSRPPATFPALPANWPERYERLAADHDLKTASFPAAAALVAALWSGMFPRGEG